MVAKILSLYRVLALLFIGSILSGCALCAPHIKVPAMRLKDPPLLMHVTRFRPRVALILGGGGARGYAHIGVLQVLHEKHIPIDLIVGSSAGSIIGSLYADHADIDQVTQVMLQAKFFDIADISIISRGGSMTGYHLERFIRKHVDAKNFAGLHIPLITVSTDLLTGDSFEIKSGPIAPAVLASAAVPGLVQPVHIYGKTLVDGGVVDNMPIDVANEYRPKMTIAVDVDREITNKLPKYSFTILGRSYRLMARQLHQLERARDKPTIFIHPHVKQASMFNLSHKQQLIQVGRDAAEQLMPKIKTELCERDILLTNKVNPCSSKS